MTTLFVASPLSYIRLFSNFYFEQITVTRWYHRGAFTRK